MELLPCPFCGANSKDLRVTNNGDEFGFFVRCLHCCVETDYHAVMEKAIDAWNRRASPASAPEGFVLVPVEPTEAMKLAWIGHKSFEGCYKAMLAAAPTPPVSEDRKDAELLDYIQNHGATIQIVPMANRTFGFEVGGLHKSRKLSVREAIDAAMQEDKP